MKAKKVEKEYLLTDDSVNVYGYRLLTSGFLMAQFQKNPIGYRMHERVKGVVLRWADLRQDGDKVYGKPVINLSHPEGQQTVDEIENGFLNAASCGSIQVLEYSEAPDLILDGQTGPTITKWCPKEISLVDIPGNPNALASHQLFDKNDQEINLTDFIQSTLRKLDLNKQFNKDLKHNKMEFKTQVIKALNLSDNTADEAVQLALKDLVAKASKVETLTLEKAHAEEALRDLKAETITKTVNDLLDKAVADKKLTVEQQKVLAVDYAENPTGLQNLIATLQPYQSVVAHIEGKSGDVPEEFKGKTWQQLQASDLLERCKNEFPDLYTELRKK